MKLYDDKLYEFISKKENFEPYVELYEQYEKIRLRLVNDFWKQVLSFVPMSASIDARWWPELDLPSESNRKLKMIHPDVISADKIRAGIVFENIESRLSLGVWFNRILLRDYNEDFIPISTQAAKEIQNIPGWKLGSDWFAIEHDTGYHFQNRDTLMQILPEERRSLAQALANDMVDAVNRFGDFCIAQAKSVRWK